MSTEQDFVGLRIDKMPAPARPVYRSTYVTVTLTAAGTAEQLLPASRDRVIAYAQARDDDVCIHGNQSDAESGHGAIIPKANTAPWPIQDSEAVYVAATTLAGATSRITLTVVHCTYPEK